MKKSGGLVSGALERNAEQTYRSRRSTYLLSLATRSAEVAAASPDRTMSRVVRLWEDALCKA